MLKYVLEDANSRTASALCGLLPCASFLDVLGHFLCARYSPAQMHARIPEILSQVACCQVLEDFGTIESAKCFLET